MRDKSKKQLFILVILIIFSCTACVKYPGGLVDNTVITSHHHPINNQESSYKHKTKAKQFVEREQVLNDTRQEEKDDRDRVQTEKKPPLKENVKGIYLNKQSMKKENIGSYIDLMKNTDLNAVVMDVKDDFGQLTYHSDVNVANEIKSDSEATVEDMKQLVKRLKKEGIYTIARIVVFKDPYLAEQKSEWAIRKKEGGIWKDTSGVQWIDPYKRSVWKYVTDIAQEAAAFGFDEIQYDYIRFPENAKEIDEVVTYDNEGDIPKAENITQFLKFSNKELQNVPIRTSADVFGLVTSSKDDMGIGQVWEDVSEEVDYISPMTYPSHYGPGIYGIEEPNDEPYELIKHAMKDAVKRNEKLGEDRAIIRPWVQDFSLKRTYTVDDVKAQIKAMEEQGIKQYLVWNARNDYTEAAY